MFLILVDRIFKTSSFLGFFGRRFSITFTQCFSVSTWFVQCFCKISTRFEQHCCNGLITIKQSQNGSNKIIKTFRPCLILTNNSTQEQT